MTSANKKRSRRLQKKLHLGEFKELGLEFEAELKAALSPEAENALSDSFLTEIVEPRSLAFGGWISGGFISCYGRGSVSEDSRKAIESWLLARPEYKTISVDPLRDAWYS
jgi:uncharacterized protein YggL (DUF469 family)